MKRTWQGIKQIININNSSTPYINQLNYKGKKLNSNINIANAFNDFFTSVGPQLDEKIPKSLRPNSELHYLNQRLNSTFHLSPTNEQEIIDIIDSLDDSKSSDPCSIPIKLIKLAKNELSTPFTDICNSSFSEGVFPDKNKIAKVIPIHKNGSVEEGNNYRPISLLSIFSKILEKLMAARLNNYLERHEILYPR